MNSQSKNLQMEIDAQLMIRELRLGDSVQLVGDRRASLLRVECQDPEATHPEATYQCDDLDWRRLRNGGRESAWVGQTRDGRLAIEVELTREADYWTCHVAITNRSLCPVASVAFTPLMLIPALSSSELNLAIPHGAGWIVPASRMSPGQRIVLNYPIHASMQWTDVLLGDTGVYLACHDREPFLKQLVIERTIDHLAVFWRYSDLHLVQGERLALPQFVIAGHTAGWWGAARFYRDWTRDWMHRPTPPEWFAQSPSWFWLSLKAQHAVAPRRRYADLPEVASQALPAPAVPQIAGWMKNGHDTNYPDFDAGDDMGSERGLAEAIDMIHERQQRAALYLNARLIDPESRFAKNGHWQDECVVLKPAVRAPAEATSGTFTGTSLPPAQPCERGKDVPRWDPHGKVAKEQYDNVVFAIACPSSSKWRDYYVEQVRKVVRTFRPDGVYLDQVCGCSSLPCYAKSHEHERPSLAWRGYLSLLESVREALRRERPECYLASEGVSDIFGQYIDVLQAHNDWSHQVLSLGIDTPELFRVTFPDRLLLIGPVSPDDTRFLKLGHVLGAGFDLYETAILASSREFRIFLERVLALRRRLDACIRGAEPCQGVTAETPGLRVFGLEREVEKGPRSILVNGAWLPTDESERRPETFSVTLSGIGDLGRWTLYTESLDGVPVQPRQVQDSLTFTVPGADIFSVLLES